jgi:hypothetical protein
LRPTPQQLRGLILVLGLILLWTAWRLAGLPPGP